MYTQSRFTASVTDSRGWPEMSYMIANTRPCDSAAGADVARDAVAESQHGGVVEADGEPLQEHARQVVLLHPAEVPVDRPRVVRRVELAPAGRQGSVNGVWHRSSGASSETSGHMSTRSVAALAGAPRAEPVLPAVERRSVVGTSEPALIAEQQLPVQRGRIDGVGSLDDSGERADRRRPGGREQPRFGSRREGSLPGPRSRQLSRCAGAIRRVRGDPFRFLE